ncbi:unnamed protein product [Pseudo-nitzschia multistriata]|uniref:Uncharacterized protein n=1 Tax=Pseudo-nitzschia multistriata TaxID=183589 RepID=A0A448ZHP7_9STRA|nr:unnamed protein product [Pseudo-nitzschia multistriata]
MLPLRVPFVLLFLLLLLLLLLCLEFALQIVVVIVVFHVESGIEIFRSGNPETSLVHDHLDDVEVGLRLDFLDGVFEFLLQGVELFLDFLDFGVEFLLRLKGLLGNVLGERLELLVRFAVDGLNDGLFLIRAGLQLVDTADGFGDVLCGKLLEVVVAAHARVLLEGVDVSPFQGWEALWVKLDWIGLDWIGSQTGFNARTSKGSVGKAHHETKNVDKQKKRVSDCSAKTTQRENRTDILGAHKALSKGSAAIRRSIDRSASQIWSFLSSVQSTLPTRATSWPAKSASTFAQSAAMALQCPHHGA